MNLLVRAIYNGVMRFFGKNQQQQQIENVQQAPEQLEEESKKQISSQDSNSEIEEEPTQKTQKQIKSFKLSKSLNSKLIIPPADVCCQKCDTIIDQIRFWSSFDSGNMKSVSISNGIFNVQIAKDLEDRQPALLNNKFKKNWFYFKVQNLNSENRQITIAITNLLKQSFNKIWSNNSDIYIKIHENDNKKSIWKSFPILKLQTQAKLIIVTFQLDLKPNQIISVAFCQPWSYKHNQNYFDKLESLIGDKSNIYFHRELLTYSLEGRKIELITITGKNDQLNEQESFYGDNNVLFPEKKERPFRFQKKYIFISCRIHASETPGSFMMKGIINFILSDQGKSFLEHFVLILIPMLNPDGVYRGYYRLDSIGYDENRIYNRLYKINKFRGPYAVLETAKYYDREQRIDTYIDLHAHSNIPSAFLFYNQISDQQQFIDIMLLPYLMSYYVPFFKNKKTDCYQLVPKKELYPEELEGELTEAENNIQDDLHWHQSKLHLKYLTEPQPNNYYQAYQYAEGLNGIAKTDVFLTTSITKTYTLECNYKYGYIGVIFICDNMQNIKVKLGTEEFIIVGEAVVKSLIETLNLRGNLSILPSKGFENIDSLRAWICTKL